MLGTTILFKQDKGQYLMLYFAYEYNLSISRFTKRVPSAALLARGYLLQYKLHIYQ